MTGFPKSSLERQNHLYHIPWITCLVQTFCIKLLCISPLVDGTTNECKRVRDLKCIIFLSPPACRLFGFLLMITKVAFLLRPALKGCVKLRSFPVVVRVTSVPSPALPQSIRFLNLLGRPHWSVYNMACPGNRMRFDLKAADVPAETDKLIESCKAVYEQVGALKAEDVTYDNVIKVHECIIDVEQYDHLFQSFLMVAAVI